MNLQKDPINKLSEEDMEPVNIQGIATMRKTFIMGQMKKEDLIEEIQA